MLQFDLVSPERALRSGPVYMVVVPGAAGDFGVLEGHAPLMSTIRPGAISVYPASMNDTPERIFIDGGFAEVSERGLTILAEHAVPVAEIDAGSLEGELADARASGQEARVARLEAMRALIVQ
ncbi:MAG: ATP synthase F1 subunit epsilon [Sphingomonadaceae bacterium]|nr:ATP synthase F1 subunit epsilon [Sphingomonadaceae bacterium]